MENKKNVTYKIRTENGKLCCKLTAGSDFRFITSAPCAYGDDTAAYAVCRCIRRFPELRDPLIREAVRLGLTLRGAGRGKRHRIRTWAAILDLPGGDAVINLIVKQGEIVLKKLVVKANRAA